MSRASGSLNPRELGRHGYQVRARFECTSGDWKALKHAFTEQRMVATMERSLDEIGLGRSLEFHKSSLELPRAP